MMESTTTKRNLTSQSQMEESIIGTGNLTSTPSICPNCGSHAKCRVRKFSTTAWQALEFWGEVSADHSGAAICDDCNHELRDVLIDRADELDEFVGSPSRQMAS